jgi:putative Mg2+ transporter-C (MgtC) family protein
MTEQPRPIAPPGAADDEAPSRPDREHREEMLDEAIEETFPASDPPAAPRFD